MTITVKARWKSTVRDQLQWNADTEIRVIDQRLGQGDRAQPPGQAKLSIFR
jgi:hypothetical protein